MEFKMSQEYFEDFDPEKFAEMIRARAAADAEAEAADEAGDDGVGRQ